MHATDMTLAMLTAPATCFELRMGKDAYLSLPAGNISVSAELNEAEIAELEGRLWIFLGKRTHLYTGGESSSVTIETAKGLLESIRFIFDEYVKSAGGNTRLLLSEGLDVAFERGLRIVETKLSETRELWHTACLSAPDIVNISYRDTLKSIGGFFKSYDYRYFAQRIPCDIDYQLCHPVPEELCGVEYVREYLCRINTENDLLRCFECEDIIRVLTSAYRDYKGLLINLYEPVVVNALGLLLIGKDTSSLQISDSDRKELLSLLNAMPQTKSQETLTSAAQELCALLGISDDFSRKYIAQTSVELYPRIEAALPSADLSAVFI